LQVLRGEIANLRDTSMQFDLSLEKAMQRLEERVNLDEIKTATQKSQSIEDEIRRIRLQ